MPSRLVRDGGGFFADTRVTVLPDQGHTAHVTAPDLFAGALTEFLKRDAATAA